MHMHNSIVDNLEYDRLSTVGSVYRSVCPACRAHHEQSFVARRVNLYTILYKCYRVACGVRGTVIQSVAYGYGSLSHWANTALEKADRSLKEPVYPPNEELLERLVNKYDIGPTREDNDKYYRILRDIMTDFSGEKLIFVWRNEAREECGHLVRNVCPPATRKWSTHSSVESKHGYWPFGLSEGDDVVLVEDCISAIRLGLAWPGVSPCALLGTSLGNLTPETLSKYGQAIRQMFVFLDPDANKQAISLAKNISGNYGSGLHNKEVRIVLGHRADPKDLYRSELAHIRSSYRIGQYE